MRFLHIADAHLDTPFAGRSNALRTRLRQAALQAVERCVDAAVEERVDAVLIAGDLLDGTHLSFSTERALLEQLFRLDEAGIQTLYVTGNHDPGDSARIGALDWPPSLTLIQGGNPVAVTVVGRSGEAVGHVVGAGYASARETADLADSLRPVAGSDLPQAALLHTQVSPQGGIHAYAPSSLQRMRRAGFDYWALGHVHAPGQLSSRPPVHYCGCIQGRSPAETGPRGGLLVDLGDRAHPSVEFREFAPLRWERLTVDSLRDARTLEAVTGEVERAWSQEVAAAEPAEGSDSGAGRSAKPPAGTEWIVAVELLGPSPIWRKLRDPGEADVLAQEISRALGVTIAEVRTAQLHPPVRPEEHLRRPDVLGATLQLAAEVAAGRDDLGLAETDLAGLGSERDETVTAYLQRVLRGAGEEIVELMLDSDADAAEANAAEARAAAASAVAGEVTDGVDSAGVDPTDAAAASEPAE